MIVAFLIILFSPLMQQRYTNILNPTLMKRAQQILFLSTFLFAFSCKEANKNQLENQLEKALEATGTEAAANWTGKLDQLFTLEMAAAATGYEASEAAKDYNQVLKSPRFHSIEYTWDKGKVKKQVVAGRSIEIPTKDFIQVSWVQNTTLEQFKHNYHTPTQEELANADKAINKKIQEMENSGKVTAEQASMAKELASSLGEGLSYDEVPNLGTYSVWNNRDKNLKVFINGLEFQVYANLGSETKNKEASIKAAQLIIDQKLK
jgi:hypothetical protein